MQIKWQDILMLLVAAFILGLLLAEHAGTRSSDVIREKEIVRARLDTVRTIIEVPMQPVVLTGRRNRVKTIVLHDTILKAACLDTLLATDTTASAPDTLSVCYARNAFTFSLGFAPRKRPVTIPYLAHDTFYWRNNSMRTEPNARPWYNDIVTIIVAVAAGMIIAKL